MHTYTYAYIHTYIHTYICTGHAWGRHIHTYIHTHTYTYIQDTSGDSKVDADEFIKFYKDSASTLSEEKIRARFKSVDAVMNSK